MLKYLLALLVSISLYGEFDLKIQNTNITTHEVNTTYNYDRLRFWGNWQEGSYFATLIADGVNYVGKEYVNSQTFSYKKLLDANTPFKTQTSFSNYDDGSFYAKLHRAYVGYEDDKNRVVAGLQNISMGVGRIWQPTNLYNPKNIYALESDETFGVAGLLYTRYFDATSHATNIISLDRDEKLRYALRYQDSFFDMDLAFDALVSEKTKMAGYEIDGSAGESGIGIRSEGAYIKSEIESFFQGLIGADYGFENGVSLIGEMLYSSKIFSYDQQLEYFDVDIVQNMVGAHYYTAISATYPVNIYLDSSFTYIAGFDGYESHFVVPSLTYTLNDYNNISIAAMLYRVENDKGVMENLNRYYLKWDLSF